MRESSKSTIDSDLRLPQYIISRSCHLLTRVPIT